MIFKALMDDADNCRRKMVAASTLITGLGGERERWTEQSKEFKAQIGRSVKTLLKYHISQSQYSFHSLENSFHSDVALFAL